MSFRKNAACGLLAGASLLAMSAPVLAQDGSVSEVEITAARLHVSVATKIDSPIVETPLSVSIVTAEQISSRGAQSVQDALLYSAGVRSDNYGIDGRIDGFSVRGASPAQYLDGLKSMYGSYVSAKIDPYALASVQVVKGPSSVLFGQGTVGGVVNMMSKRPSFVAANEINLSVGSYNRKEVRADFTGPLLGRDDFAFRLVAILRDADTQVDVVKDNRIYISPSLTWAPSDRTDVTLLVRHQQDRTGSTTQFLPWEGTIFANPNGRLPSSTYIGEPDWEKFNADQDEASVFVRHELNDILTFRSNFRYTWAKVDYQTIYSNSFTNPFNPFLQPGQAGYTGVKRNVNRTLSGSYPRSNTYGIDNQLLAKFKTGALEHTLLGGVDAQRYSQTQTAVTSRATTPIDLYNPVYGAYTRPTVRTPGNTVKQSQTGFYVQDQIVLGGWHILGGLRHDEAKSTTITPARVFTRKKDSAVTGRIGALYAFEKGLSTYVSYAESFNPVAGTNLSGVAWDPQKGKQVEAGVKWQPNANALLTAAVYDLRDTNRLTAHPTIANERVQTGEVRTKGYELEADATIKGVWVVQAAYTYSDAYVSKSNNPLELDKPLASVPKHAASAFGFRRFDFGDKGMIRVGGGVRYTGETFDRSLANPPYLLRTPPHTLADVMASYERDQWRLALNVNNVTDKYYYAACLTRGDCFIGARRSVVATLGYRF